jgi:hypothetical protein
VRPPLGICPRKAQLSYWARVTRSLKGVLASKKGKGMSFAQIREAAATVARKREGST